MKNIPQPAPDPFDGYQETILPIPSEIIGTVSGLPSQGFSASQKRNHARLVNAMLDDHRPGVVVTVVNRDGSVKIFTVNQFTIAPE